MTMRKLNTCNLKRVILICVFEARGRAPRRDDFLMAILHTENDKVFAQLMVNEKPSQSKQCQCHVSDVMTANSLSLYVDYVYFMNLFKDF